MYEAFEIAEQASYIQGWEAGKKSATRCQRFVDATEALGLVAIVFAAGLAVGLYILAPAF